jgi:hypothetical protein
MIVHQDLIDACTNATGLDTAKLERWRALLSHNGICTAQDWRDIRSMPTFNYKKYPGALLGYLDQLTGVAPAGTPTIRAWRFLLAFM